MTGQTCTSPSQCFSMFQWEYLPEICLNLFSSAPCLVKTQISLHLFLYWGARWGAEPKVTSQWPGAILPLSTSSLAEICLPELCQQLALLLSPAPRSSQASNPNIPEQHCASNAQEGHTGWEEAASLLFVTCGWCTQPAVSQFSPTGWGREGRMSSRCLKTSVWQGREGKAQRVALCKKELQSPARTARANVAPETPWTSICTPKRPRAYRTA